MNKVNVDMKWLFDIIDSYKTQLNEEIKNIQKDRDCTYSGMSEIDQLDFTIEKIEELENTIKQFIKDVKP